MAFSCSQLGSCWPVNFGFTGLFVTMRLYRNTKIQELYMAFSLLNNWIR